MNTSSRSEEVNALSLNEAIPTSNQNSEAELSPK